MSFIFSFPTEILHQGFPLGYDELKQEELQECEEGRRWLTEVFAQILRQRLPKVDEVEKEVKQRPFLPLPSLTSNSLPASSTHKHQGICPNTFFSLSLAIIKFLP